MIDLAGKRQEMSSVHRAGEIPTMGKKKSAITGALSV